MKLTYLTVLAKILAMTLLEAGVLGLVQGITEFIPISSSGHLILTDSFLDSESTFNFDALLNIGTLMALLIYFRHKLWDIVISVVQDKNWRLVVNIIISTIPAALIGFLIAGSLEDGALRNTWIVITMLFVGGLIMVFESKFKPKNKFTLESLTKPRALGIGFAQALALIPGTSRSGATILAGRFSGLSHELSAEYSFLIAIPILAGALLKTLTSSETAELFNSSQAGALIVGITTSFIAGFLAISFMIKYLRNHGLKVFGYYRIAVAVLLLITLL